MADSRHYFRTAFFLAAILFLLLASALAISLQKTGPETPKNASEGQNTGPVTGEDHENMAENDAEGQENGAFNEKTRETGPQSGFSLVGVNIGWPQGSETIYTLGDVNIEISDSN